jgi:pimeloyl-ACP methyl ester carboxylesterase
VHFLDAGSGPVVLLIHAFPLHHAMWQPQVPVLAKRFRVIAPDLRGFGESRPSSPWTIDEMGDDLNEFLTRLDIPDCALAGVSIGGYIGLPFTLKYPRRVRQLVLSNTRARADTETEKAARTEMIALIQETGTSSLPERMLPRLLRPDPPPQVAATVRSMIEGADAAAAIHAVTAMRDRPDCTAQLNRLRCPTLVITGERDSIIRVEDARAMAEAIPDSRFAVIPGSGHLSNLENPEEYSRVLDQFLV